MNINGNIAERIMVVDDRPSNLTLLRDILNERGYHVATFPRARLALEAARRNPPDLIVLDVNMPDMNGFEACKYIKSDGSLREIPVVFISALSSAEDKVNAFALGGIDYITKPFLSEEVFARLETHLRLRRLQSQMQQHNLDLEERVHEQVLEISEAQLATINALSRIAESRDEDTGKHIERTQGFCRMLAEHLVSAGQFTDIIDASFIDNIFHAAPLHDIGKVGIPDNILLKPGKLTAEEFELMKRHASIGANTLSSVYEQYPKNAFLSMGIDISRHHHEKWDGSGYPDGLAGDDIPLSARIMALADVYDALRARRPYKTPFDHKRTFDIITEGAGTHFDPRVVEAFVDIEHDFAHLHQRLNDEADTADGMQPEHPNLNLV
jgi:putative two-component system response regulator